MIRFLLFLSGRITYSFIHSIPFEDTTNISASIMAAYCILNTFWLLCILLLIFAFGNGDTLISILYIIFYPLILLFIRYLNKSKHKS